MIGIWISFLRFLIRPQPVEDLVSRSIDPSSRISILSLIRSVQIFGLKDPKTALEGIDDGDKIE